MSKEAYEVGTKLPDVDHAGVLRCLPHRFPMLMVDRVVEIEAFKRAVGVKGVTFNEPFFQGHFPSDPIMPGVLIIEALAQAAAVLTLLSLGNPDGGSLVYFMSIDEARFRRPVRPGDQLRLEVELERAKMGVYRYRGRARVNGDIAAESVFAAKIMAAPG